MRNTRFGRLLPAALALFLGSGAAPRAAPSAVIAPASDVSAAIERALDWLAAHQSPDGSWDCDGFMQQCGSAAPACDGAGSKSHDVGVTGLALLAFVRASPGAKAHASAIERGLAWLVSQQDDDGCIGKRMGQHFLYNHACAALALTEAYGETRAESLQEPVRRAVDFVLASRNPYAAWRYSSPADGDNDTSVTGWMVKVLVAARSAELEVADEALAGALGWVDAITDPETGRTGYNVIGSSPARVASAMTTFPPDLSEATTAIGVLTRFGCGRTSKQDPLIAKGAALLAARVPRWDGGSVDFYYWYYGTLALQRVGGPDLKKWNTALERALLEHQRKDAKGHARGSWDLADPWSADGGRVYATALNCLSLEACSARPKR